MFSKLIRKEKSRGGVVGVLVFALALVVGCVGPSKTNLRLFEEAKIMLAPTLSELTSLADRDGRFPSSIETHLEQADLLDDQISVEKKSNFGPNSEVYYVTIADHEPPIRILYNLRCGAETSLCVEFIATETGGHHCFWRLDTNEWECAPQNI